MIFASQWEVNSDIPEKGSIKHPEKDVKQKKSTKIEFFQNAKY